MSELSYISVYKILYLDFFHQSKGILHIYRLPNATNYETETMQFFLLSLISFNQ